MLRATLLLGTILVLASCGQSDNRQALMDPTSAAMNQQAPDEFKVEFSTSKGKFVVLVHREWAPIGADRFYNLVRNGYYDDQRLFRVVPGFVVQFGIHGDPEIAKLWFSHPQLNPKYHNAVKLKDEPVKQSNKRGTITYAKGGPDSRTTQVFVNLNDNSRSLDGLGFSPFGEVIEGFENVEAFYGGYGDQTLRRTGEILQQGNEFLAKKYPKLDSIQQARIVD